MAGKTPEEYALEAGKEFDVAISEAIKKVLKQSVTTDKQTHFDTMRALHAVLCRHTGAMEAMLVRSGPSYEEKYKEARDSYIKMGADLVFDHLAQSSN